MLVLGVFRDFGVCSSAAVIDFLAHLTPFPRVMIHLMSMDGLVRDLVVRVTGVIVHL